MWVLIGWETQPLYVAVHNQGRATPRCGVQAVSLPMFSYPQKFQFLCRRERPLPCPNTPATSTQQVSASSYLCLSNTRSKAADVEHRGHVALLTQRCPVVGGMPLCRSSPVLSSSATPRAKSANRTAHPGDKTAHDPRNRPSMNITMSFFFMISERD